MFLSKIEWTSKNISLLSIYHKSTNSINLEIIIFDEN